MCLRRLESLMNLKRSGACASILVWISGCTPTIPVTESSGLDTGLTPSSEDTATPSSTTGGTSTSIETIPGTTTPTTPTTTTPTTTETSGGWCLDWEDGSLRDAGYHGEQVQLDDGAILLVVREGDGFSALVGEDEIELRDLRALVMRSSDLGEVSSVAVAITPEFRVEAPLLWWWQLSEVGLGGVAIDAELVDDSGAVVAALEVPAETGGYVPALQEHHEPIEAVPEIGYGEHSPGELTLQATDVSAFVGMDLSLRLYQHTLVPDNGFFTIIDDICHGQTPDSDVAPSMLDWDAG